MKLFIPTGALVSNVLGMAIQQRQPAEEVTAIHGEQGTQFTAWTSSQRAVDSGLLSSMRSVGNCYDNARGGRFWSCMQVELLDRQRWKRRALLAHAIIEYLEIFHDRRRRHSALGMVSPVEYELQQARSTAAGSP